MTYKNILAISLCFLHSLFFVASAGAENDSALIAPAMDKGFLVAAIERETPTYVPTKEITGITVPHHLLAADLIARGFWAASGGQYGRVIILSPDHFRRLRSPFGVSRSPVSTVFGNVEADVKALDTLTASKVVTEIDLAHEHGIQALIPFVRYFFPSARIVPVIVSTEASTGDWAEMAELIGDLVDQDTLVVQSTDYSHYLPIAAAALRDQETLAVIAEGRPDKVLQLIPSEHMDSRGSQFIQMTLQRSIGTTSVVIANRSSREYGGGPNSTTSYIVTIYGRSDRDLSKITYPDQSVVYFGGDFLAGRYMAPLLTSPSVRRSIEQEVLAITEGKPLIINMEGVLLNEPVTNAPWNSHMMQLSAAEPILRSLNVIGAGLANNHSMDFGNEGYIGTIKSLTQVNIRPLLHGKMENFGIFQILPLLMFSPARTGGDWIASEDELAIACKLASGGPVIAFLHWGKEFTNETDDKERNYARRLSSCGISAIIGAHSHIASTSIDATSGQTQTVFSVGNFIFDQSAKWATSALVEVRIFDQGTLTLRLIKMANIFDLASETYALDNTRVP
ncbi:poly-gamma-glutamate synthesis protein (capsule biosynthesis protein) [Rhizobium sp. PP-CC-2G-626]|nr:poly-gamma-glutamate synthesis protein (capsule biosynthesis protein) [Rhizobium sp. PP-CC-2G-626]